MKYKIIILIALLTCLLFFLPLKKEKATHQFVEVKKGNISKIIESPAFIESRQEIQISSQVTGKIDKIYVKKGEKVKKDQKLVSLFAEDYKSELLSVQAKVEQIKLNISIIEQEIDKSKRDLNRSNKLRSSNATTQVELDDLKTVYLKDLNRLEIAKKQLVETEAMLKKSETNFENTLIKSPIDGIVSLIFLRSGENVIQGHPNTPGVIIMMLHTENEIVAKCRIDETDIPYIKVGQKAIISLQYDESVKLDGEVVEADIKGFRNKNEDVSYFECLVKINNPPKEIRLGMTASVEIFVDEKKNTLLLPSSVIFNKREGKKYTHYVFDEQLNRKDIQIGISNDENVEVIGLAENDKILSK